LEQVLTTLADRIDGLRVGDLRRATANSTVPFGAVTPTWKEDENDAVAAPL
jgi:hypothetical protein